MSKKKSTTTKKTTTKNADQPAILPMGPAKKKGKPGARHFGPRGFWPILPHFS